MSSHDDLWRTPAHALASRLRSGEISAAELLEAHLARIAARNPTLNAVVSLDAEAARRAARAADMALRRGDAVGPLHGVPMTLKDGHDVAGQRTTLGVPALDRVAETDGTVAARLRGAGAILVGHTNVAAGLADPGQTANPIFGRTANPWDPTRSPGGSSGGAAAALAAGMTPLEVGSDLAGSIRVPAAFTGVYGLKSTERRVPMTGFFRLPGDPPRAVRVLAALGPMARDLDDLELCLRILAGPDDADTEVPPVPLRERPRPGVGDLVLAVAPALPGATVAQSVRRRLARLAADAEEAGARVVSRLPDVDWDSVGALLGELVAAVTTAFEPGAEPRTLAWYLDALHRRDRTIAACQRFFDGIDALVLPVTPAPPFTHRDTGADLEIDGAQVSYWEGGRLVGLGNVAGLPALAVPAGRDEDGLPIGVQLVGPLWSELRLLGVARALEDARVLPGYAFPP